MEDFDYKGYVITEESEGCFVVDGNEFSTYEEACEWVDEMISFESSDEDEEDIEDDYDIHTYHIFYVTKDYNRGYDEFVDAYSPEEAERKLRSMYHDIAYIADCYPIN